MVSALVGARGAVWLIRGIGHVTGKHQVTGLPLPGAMFLVIADTVSFVYSPCRPVLSCIGIPVRAGTSLAAAGANAAGRNTHASRSGSGCSGPNPAPSCRRGGNDTPTTYGGFPGVVAPQEIQEALGVRVFSGTVGRGRFIIPPGSQGKGPRFFRPPGLTGTVRQAVARECQVLFMGRLGQRGRGFFSYIA